MAVDLDAAYTEFSFLKQQSQQRNYEYYLLRQSVAGNFRWPRDWPKHIPRITHNLCKPITERFVTYLMGKGFTYNVDRPNTLEFREQAERTEKILRRLLKLSKSQIQFNLGAQTGSELGRTIFKVYKRGKEGAEHACFNYCQPDYFYGIASSDDHTSDWSVVYYSYPMDIAEARRTFGEGDYKSQSQMDSQRTYEPLRESQSDDIRLKDRKIPVLEVWTKDDYALVVGGVVIENGPNPYKRKLDGEGFIPFVVIENIRRSGENRGEGDISQARELNEAYNRLLSRKSYIVNRWLQPTLFWEGAPQNYGEVLAQTLGGGGAIPGRIGSRISFLSYDRPNPSVVELEATLRAAILESAGMSEIALQGTVQGSINTGPALAAQFQPVLSTVEKKRQEWEYGLQSLFSMLLELQEDIGDSKVLGQAVINQTIQSENGSDGELVDLSGTDIMGLRDVSVAWPGVLPKDDIESSRLELEKHAQGVQSLYTTLEKLGEEYPDDEIAKIRMENTDPALKGEKVAEQMRSQAPMINAQANMMKAQNEVAQGGQDPNADPYAQDPNQDPSAPDTGIGAQLRALAQRQPQMDMSGDEPVIGYPDQQAAA